MACCLLANLFIGGIWRRTPGEISRMGATGSHSASVVQNLLGPRWRLWISLLVASELALAVVLGMVLAGLLSGAGSAGHTGHGEHAGHLAAASPAAAITFLVLALLATIACGVVQARDASRRVILVTVFAGLALAIAAAVTPGAWDLHSSWMALYMLVAVAVPAVVGPYLRRTRSGPAVAELTVRISAPLLATAAALLMIAAHLPVVHSWLMGDAAGRVAVCVVAFGIGVPLWSTLLGDERPALRTARVGALIAFAAPAGLLGLVLLVAPAPLWPSMVEVPWLPALWDQRLSGVLMMGADLVFLVPLLSSALGAGGRAAIAVERTA